jgi:hypothetical protein
MFSSNAQGICDCFQKQKFLHVDVEIRARFWTFFFAVLKLASRVARSKSRRPTRDRAFSLEFFQPRNRRSDGRRRRSRLSSLLPQSNSSSNLHSEIQLLHYPTVQSYTAVNLNHRYFQPHCTHRSAQVCCQEPQLCQRVKAVIGPR